MKKRMFFILACFFCFAMQAFAQENFIPGYVITKSSDTLTGYIDFKDWEKNPTKILFKESVNSNKLTYRPADIAGFEVGGHMYVSEFVKREESPRKAGNLQYDSELHFVEDTIFLEVLYDGTKSLYTYTDKAGRAFFYVEMEGDVQLLIYKRYLKMLEGNQKIVENTTYLGQLSLYLNDCPSVRNKLENLDYNRKALMKLWRYYYVCIDEVPVYRLEYEGIKPNFGMLGGISYTKLVFESDYIDFLDGADFEPSLSYTVGMYVDFVFPKNQGKWSLYNEIQLSSYEVEGVFEEFESAERYSTTETSFGYIYFNINTLVRYRFPLKKHTFFINAGLSHGFVIDETNFRVEETKYDANHWTERKKGLKETRGYELAFIGGIGGYFDRISYEIRYEQGNGMADYTTLKSTTHKYFFIVGYRF
jgi:hypothetical protein